MKYDNNLVYYDKWNDQDKGEIKIYDIDNYRIIVMYWNGTTISIYNKKDIPIDNTDLIWDKMNSCNPLSIGELYFNEKLDEGIDRCMHKINHPNQILWISKINNNSTDHGELKYTDDDLPETKKKIEEDPTFDGYLLF